MQLAYAQRDTDGVWSTPMILTGLDSGSVSYPSIACEADSGIHIVWYDASSGNQDVYYLRGLLPGSAVTETPSVELRTSNAGPAIVRGDLLQTAACGMQNGRAFFDACGRMTRDLRPGVYFIRTPGGRRLTRVIVAR